MLSSFFSSSKPIHHVIFIGLLITGLLNTFLRQLDPINLNSILWGIILIITAGVYQFIVSRNELTKPNAYASFILVILLLSLLPYLYKDSILFTLFFILLGLRRLLSLRSGVAVVRKIYDASFWLTCAAVLTPGAFLYLILVFLAVLFYAPNDHRHWLTPFLGIFSTIILVLLAHLYLPQLDLPHLSELGISLGSWDTLTPYAGLIIPFYSILAGTVFIVIYLAGVLNLQQRVLPRFTVVAFYLIITLILIILKGSSSLIINSLLIIPVAAISTAQLAEKSSKTIFKDLVLAIPLLLMVMSLIFR